MVSVGKSEQMRGVNLGMGARIDFRDADANARENLPILGVYTLLSIPVVSVFY